MKVACITEQVLTLVNKRLGLYRHFDEAVNKYKQSRDISTLNSGKKSLETEHKALTNEIAALQSKLKTEGSDLCDKVRFYSFQVLLLLAVKYSRQFNLRFNFCSLYLSPSPQYLDPCLRVWRSAFSFPICSNLGYAALEVLLVKQLLAMFLKQPLKPAAWVQVNIFLTKSWCLLLSSWQWHVGKNRNYQHIISSDAATHASQTKIFSLISYFLACVNLVLTDF